MPYLLEEEDVDRTMAVTMDTRTVAAGMHTIPTAVAADIYGNPGPTVEAAVAVGPLVEAAGYTVLAVGPNAVAVGPNDVAVGPLVEAAGSTVLAVGPNAPNNCKYPEFCKPSLLPPPSAKRGRVNSRQI